MRIGVQALQIDDSYQTYNDVIAHVENNIGQATQTALENSILEQTQYTNVGGALIPVGSSLTRTHLAYTLEAKWYRSVFVPNNGFINFSFEVEDGSWGVANAKITLESNTGNHEETVSNINVVNGVVSFPAIMVNKFSSISKLRIDIYFNNGREAYLELLKIPNNQLFTGLLTLKPGRELESTEQIQEETKRKNFGIKRLGIADYLKVVQSVHAYVPGEVSNIENVMASELRHKSSVSREYSEVTDTTSKSVETEKVSDTSKTSRTDMQTEVAKELDKQQSITAYAHFSYDSGYKLDIGSDYANNTAQHDSTRQAMMKSQEITERAMERVLTKINEERVQKNYQRIYRNQCT
ncbi:hypothetical protein ACFOEQ_18845 [Chryseobacterium arachidis]|uniref:hypothetical protein n=1 Tax=Chryseobacterium arachidis TaxID=1416778 RepID=UPI00361EBE89